MEYSEKLSILIIGLVLWSAQSCRFCSCEKAMRLIYNWSKAERLMLGDAVEI